MAESAKDELIRRIAIYPPDSLPYFRQGFAAASSLTEEVRAKVLAEMIDNFRRGIRRVDASSLAAVTELPSRDAEQIASIYSIVIGLMSVSAASADEFVEAACDKLFSAEDRNTAGSIARAVCGSRDEIKASVEKTQLAGEVLPSLLAFNVAIDLRMRIVDQAVALAVPVAVVYLGTDAESHDMWLQLSQGDVEAVIKKLSKALEDMKIAETSILGKS